MAKYISLALFFILFYVSSVSSADVLTCLTQEVENFVGKTLPTTINNFQSPRVCTKSNIPAIAASFDKLAKGQIAKCAGDLLCLAETLLKYQFNLIVNAAECEKEWAMNGPLPTLIKTISTKVDKCMEGVLPLFFE